MVLYNVPERLVNRNNLRHSVYDQTTSRPSAFKPMRSAYLSLVVDSTEGAERIYALLSDGGEIFMKMEETFFAFRFGMLRDKFGASWMVLHERPRP